jgi:hypothetical protein
MHSVRDCVVKAVGLSVGLCNWQRSATPPSWVGACVYLDSSVHAYANTRKEALNPPHALNRSVQAIYIYTGLIIHCNFMIKHLKESGMLGYCCGLRASGQQQMRHDSMTSHAATRAQALGDLQCGCGPHPCLPVRPRHILLGAGNRFEHYAASPIRRWVATPGKTRCTT